MSSDTTRRPRSAARDVRWRPRDGDGLEHLRVSFDPLRADGVVLGESDGEPFRVRYRVDCDAAGRVRSVRLDALDALDGPTDAPVEPAISADSSLDLRADGAGRWTDGTGDPLPALDGCLDADISATPFTNALPVRRLDLEPGESATLPMCYLSVPEFEATAVEQRYERLAPSGGDTACGYAGRYRYESLTSGFTAELPVDADGIVRDYPGLFERVD